MRILALPEVKAEFDKTAYETRRSSPAEFGEQVRQSHALWGRIAESLGVRKE